MNRMRGCAGLAICTPRADAAWWPNPGRRTPMTILSRRHFLAATAASATSAGGPAVAAQAGGDVDIAVIGAGAAGMAAARRITGARAKVAVIEASNRIGGRCFTESTTFGVPFDRGAHWIHMPDLNPAAPLARKLGFDIYPAPPWQRVRLGRRNARPGEMEDFLAAMVRANRAIADAGRGRVDVPCSQALPKDFGRLEGHGRLRARPVRVRQGPCRCVGG